MFSRHYGLVWLILSIIMGVVACSSSVSVDELLLRAQRAMDAKDWRAAEIDAKSILQHDPNHAVGRGLLAEVYFHQRRFTEAATEFERAGTSGEDSKSAIFYAKSLLAAGDSLRLMALNESGKFILVKDDPVFLATLAWAKLVMGDLSLAHDFLIASRARGEDHPEIRLAEALFALNVAENPAHAIEILRGLTDTFPDYEDGWSLAGYVALMRSNLVEAEKAFAHSVSLNPYRFEDQLLRINALLDLGKRDLASRELQVAARKAPQHPGVYFVRARVLLDANDPNGALEELQKILALDPDHEPSLYLAGVANVGAGNPATALEQLTRFVAANPHHVAARLLQGQVYLRLNDQHSARAVAHDLLVENPDNEDAQRLLAQAANQSSPGLGELQAGRDALRHKEQRRAHQHFLKALELDPMLAEARLKLTRMAIAEGDTLKALKFIEDGLALQPDNLPGLLDLAGVHIQVGDETAAVDALQRAISAHPEALQPRLVLGRYLLLKGDVGASVHLLEDARLLHADQDELQSLLVAAYLAGGQPDKAAETGRALLALMPYHVETLTLMARIERTRGDLNATEYYLRRLLDIQADNIVARQALIESLLRQGKVAEAGRQFESFPDGVLSQEELDLIQGRIAAVLCDRRHGETLLREAYEKTPNQHTLRQLALALAHEGDTRAQAIELLENWLETHPEDEVALEMLHAMTR